MLLLAGGGLLDARELRTERPRRHGEGRQGGRDLRVLQLGLCIHAAGSRRGVGRHASSPAKAGDPVIRGASDGAEKPQRTGYSAFAEYDDVLWISACATP